MDEGVGAGVGPDDASEELGVVLRRVNRIRAEHGADPLYELPRARPASEPASTCVLQRAFADIGVLVVDYRYLLGRGFRVEHGLGSFVRRFDAGRFPELVEG